VIGLDTNTFNEIQRQQQMQQQYGSTFATPPNPDQNSGYVDPTARINGTFFEESSGGSLY
jgi:hypothetical protein